MASSSNSSSSSSNSPLNSDGSLSNGPSSSSSSSSERLHDQTQERKALAYAVQYMFQEVDKAKQGNRQLNQVEQQHVAKCRRQAQLNGVAGAIGGMTLTHILTSRWLSNGSGNGSGKKKDKAFRKTPNSVSFSFSFSSPKGKGRWKLPLTLLGGITGFAVGTFSAGQQCMVQILTLPGSELGDEAREILHQQAPPNSKMVQFVEKEYEQQSSGLLRQHQSQNQSQNLSQSQSQNPQNGQNPIQRERLRLQAPGEEGRWNEQGNQASPSSPSPSSSSSSSSSSSYSPSFDFSTGTSDQDRRRETAKEREGTTVSGSDREKRSRSGISGIPESRSPSSSSSSSPPPPPPSPPATMSRIPGSSIESSMNQDLNQSQSPNQSQNRHHNQDQDRTNHIGIAPAIESHQRLSPGAYNQSGNSTSRDPFSFPQLDEYHHQQSTLSSRNQESKRRDPTVAQDGGIQPSTTVPSWDDFDDPYKFSPVYENNANADRTWEDVRNAANNEGSAREGGWKEGRSM